MLLVNYGKITEVSTMQLKIWETKSLITWERKTHRWKSSPIKIRIERVSKRMVKLPRVFLVTYRSLALCLSASYGPPRAPGKKQPCCTAAGDQGSVSLHVLAKIQLPSCLAGRFFLKLNFWRNKRIAVSKQQIYYLNFWNYIYVYISPMITC